ncbi:putative 35 kDa ribonuclease H [Durotheca rogersii]|uniref:putative 35 kDa ribonuclease H n=1 Tax=Durotheca rogersii TaxID=419775 RepID=UPI00221EAC7A|nr:putative 35 kDa ribonuclease H [Durotheca rogersii]KAI5864280.1 putative 35 kDa ribonuclease H [Durotheca rogersii]
MEDIQMDDGNADLDTPASDVFVPPSIQRPATLAGDSYTYFSPVPPSLLGNAEPSTTESPDPSPASQDPAPASLPCVLGVDEAGRGPVLGPMVYGVFYLPLSLSDALLRETPEHRFDDSKVLTPAVRSALMRTLCAPGSALHASCSWAVSCLSARDIGANMQRPAAAAPYNLNAQALDATVDLIRGVLARGVNVREIYVDTVGPPATHQAKLARLFPNVNITVAKKADSIYPCVSAASVCAKVTRDAALEVLYEDRIAQGPGAPRHRSAPGGGNDDDNAEKEPEAENKELSWGSGYPSDPRCVTWLRRNMHPVFGWGPECRFSWGTAKDMLETRGGVKVEWPADEEDGTSRLTDFFVGGDREKEADELGNWFGTPTGLEAF